MPTSSMFSSEQIKVPHELPDILKDYTKEVRIGLLIILHHCVQVIRHFSKSKAENNHDADRKELIEFSKKYFDAEYQRL
jgi:hypothetical protein